MVCKLQSVSYSQAYSSGIMSSSYNISYNSSAMFIVSLPLEFFVDIIYYFFVNYN